MPLYQPRITRIKHGATGFNFCAHHPLPVGRCIPIAVSIAHILVAQYATDSNFQRTNLRTRSLQPPIHTCHHAAPERKVCHGTGLSLAICPFSINIAYMSPVNKCTGRYTLYHIVRRFNARQRVLQLRRLAVIGQNLLQRRSYAASQTALRAGALIRCIIRTRKVVRSRLPAHALQEGRNYGIGSPRLRSGHNTIQVTILHQSRMQRLRHGAEARAAIPHHGRRTCMKQYESTVTALHPINGTPAHGVYPFLTTAYHGLRILDQKPLPPDATGFVRRQRLRHGGQLQQAGRQGHPPRAPTFVWFTHPAPCES